MRLQVRALRAQLGWAWPVRRFVVVCRTQSPIIARKIARVREFAERLVPLLGAEALDRDFRLIGPLRDCAGRDYTEIWERYLRADDPDCDRLMLDAAFYTRNGRLYNRGTSLLMVGYARPLALTGLLLVKLRPRPWPDRGPLVRAS